MRGALSRVDAAHYLGVCARTFDNYVIAGEIPRVKLGTRTVYRVVDLDALLESHLEVPTKKPPGNQEAKVA